jgi:hypothetical protein
MIIVPGFLYLNIILNNIEDFITITMNIKNKKTIFIKSKLYLYVYFFVLSLAIISIIFMVNNFFYTINIKTFPDEKIIFQKKISPNQKISLAYIHSVAQTPVWEFFKIDNGGKMMLTETHFHDHGAGLPYAAFENEIFVIEDHKFKIKNMHREIGLPLYYRIYKDRGNILVFNKQEINLSDTIGDSLLIIDIKRLNVIRYFLENLRVQEKMYEK